MDVFCTGGPGGQNQNKNQNGVRFTLIPLGLSAESRTFKSQSQNKKAAFHKLGQKVLMWHREQERIERTRIVDTVRTYHAVENRVKDHATGLMQPYHTVLNDATEMIETRAMCMRREE